MSEEIMTRIIHREIAFEKNVSDFKWVSSGLIIFASIILIHYSKTFSWVKLFYGGIFEVPFSIVMGLTITVYASLFVYSHLKWLKRFNITQHRNR